MDIIAGEEANASIDLSLPPVGVGAVQHLDDVPAVEGQLGAVMGREVELGLHEFGSFHLQGNPKQRHQEWGDDPASTSSSALGAGDTAKTNERGWEQRKSCMGRAGGPQGQGRAWDVGESPS